MTSAVRGCIGGVRVGVSVTVRRKLPRVRPKQRSVVRRPANLELDLLDPARALVLDVERGIGRHAQPFAGDLDGERLAGLDRIGKAAKLGDELGAGIGALE